MTKYIEDTLSSFRRCFSRTNCFKWFVIVICALMLRSDQLGITLVIRDLNLSHTWYESLLLFFRSKAYKLSVLRRQWYTIVARNAPIHRVSGRAIIIGDGVKQSKERRVPGASDPYDPASSPGWNSGLKDVKNDDVGFLTTLACRLQKEYGFDKRRTFSAGFSNGTFMIMALRLSSYFSRMSGLPGLEARIAPHAA